MLHTYRKRCDKILTLQLIELNEKQTSEIGIQLQNHGNKTFINSIEPIKNRTLFTCPLQRTL